MCAGDASDQDGDGVADSLDAAPLDPAISTVHRYYFDGDGDSYGDPGYPIDVPIITPLPYLSVWGDDPDDRDAYQIPAVVPKGGRTMGIDAGNSAADGRWRLDLARELGADAVTLRVSWASVETAPGEFDPGVGDTLEVLAAFYRANGLKISLSLDPIGGTSLTTPADLRDGLADGSLRFDSAEVVDRFLALVQYVHGQMDGTALASLQVGYEVDLYDRLAPSAAFWPGYATLVGRASAEAKSLWGPSLQVGVTATQAGLLAPATGDAMRAVNEPADFVSLTYLPRGADYGAPDAEAIELDVQRVIQAYYPKPLHFQDIAFPSSPAVGARRRSRGRRCARSSTCGTGTRQSSRTWPSGG